MSSRGTYPLDCVIAEVWYIVFFMLVMDAIIQVERVWWLFL